MSLQHTLLAPIVLATALLSGSARAASEKPRAAVLVELFTSEGCSSCPPADALLARLAEQQPVEGAQIIVLGEHVDYWDELGWRDRFSSRQYTARQGEYGRRFSLESVYTPQMVVDGAAQFVGNDQEQARQAVTQAARRIKLPLVLSTPIVDGTKFSASVSASLADGAKMPQGDLYAALVDPIDTTEVRRGENSGKRLRHVAVVRTLARIGSTQDWAKGPVVFTVNAPEGASPAAMQVVVFAQQLGAGQVFGAVMSGPTPIGRAEPIPAVVESSGR